jgi:hypothetical protein
MNRARFSRQKSQTSWPASPCGSNSKSAKGARKPRQTVARKALWGRAATTGASMERDFSNQDAVHHLVYALGCALEWTFAVWLLTHGESYRPLSTWLAYFLLAETGACVLFGFGWYFCWAYERNVTLWYLAGVASLVGAACVALDSMFALRFQNWDVALSFSILYFAAGYGAWRLVRFFVVRSFNILLLAVSQIGAAWRGELRH